jgi:CDP-glucose 4,6-dehydratase
MFNNFYHNKKIIITGNTGFKGTWLTASLLIMNAKIIGISNNIPTKPSMFEAIIKKKKIKQYYQDINNFTEINKIINNEKPDLIFHLAAQSLVKKSYTETLETWKTNVIGTANILESLKKYKKKITLILITSDKSYINKEWIWGYRETDELGGKDPYSGSKASAENVIFSYFNSFFKTKKTNIKIGIARAGNVIGGGDWAKDRIVPDCIRKWSKNRKAEIYNPESTRPWQHVLEPISGYLQLAFILNTNKTLNGEAFNFGPHNNQNKTVKDLVIKMAKYWDNKSWNIKKQKTKIIESKLLSLNCEKANEYLNWEPTLSFDEMSKFTIEWYKAFYNNKNQLIDITNNQILFFMKKFEKNHEK